MIFVKRFLKVFPAILAAALLLHSAAQVCAASGQISNQIFVTAPDGIKVAVQEYGNPKGREIVFVHGLDGSHLDWMEQYESPLLRKYRIITYDLRGHGFSGKPTQASYYSDGKRWGEELHSVIAVKHLKRPVLVGWSLGGPIITNYLGLYGDAHVAGLVYVDGVIELKPAFLVSHPATAAALTSSQLSAYLEGTRQFIRQCFFKQPSPSAFALLYANAALASPEMVRQAFTGLSIPAASVLPKVTVPTLYIYGEKDNLVSPQMVTRARQLLPHLKVILYPQTGHASFWEQPVRFNKDLDRFLRQQAAQVSRVSRADAG